MKVIVVANTKGGVGKSTITCNLAVLAAMKGKKVLVMDSDFQGTSTVFRTIREKDDIQAVTNVMPKIHTDIKQFDNFDLVFVDAGGKDGAVFRSAVMAAGNGVLLMPLQPSAADIWGTEDAFKILREARAYIDIPAYAVFNQTNVNIRVKVTREAEEVLQELTKECEVNLLKTKLYSRNDYKLSIGEGKSVVEYDPKGKAAVEIVALYDELINILQWEELKDATKA
jgi:chromosome partitioning protein